MDIEEFDYDPRANCRDCSWNAVVDARERARKHAESEGHTTEVTVTCVFVGSHRPD